MAGEEDAFLGLGVPLDEDILHADGESGEGVAGVEGLEFDGDVELLKVFYEKGLLLAHAGGPAGSGADAADFDEVVKGPFGVDLGGGFGEGARGGHQGSPKDQGEVERGWSEARPHAEVIHE